MDPRLLQYYNVELQHLREMGAEFAVQFPKIAARLGLHGLEVADPYVERLLEGVAFLAARVQLKLDAEFPRFTQALLEAVYPHYLAPTPSMIVAQLKPDPNVPTLSAGVTVPRGSTLHGHTGAADATACEFRTAHDVRLWPAGVSSASYFSFAPDLPLNALPIATRIKGGLRIRLETTAGLRFAQTAIDRLTFYLSGGQDVANTLYELCLGSPVGVLVLRSDGYDLLPASSIQPVGFSDEEALLPGTLRSFHGYRLLQEYFALPERFRFFDVGGLASSIARSDAASIEIVILFGRTEPALERVVDGSNVSLFCTPAVNLFHKRADRIHLSEGVHESHVVVDRTRPLDFEVYAVTEVVGHGVGADSERRFLPLYTTDRDTPREREQAYFTTRREPRLVSAAQQRRGGRSSYIGTEVFLSLVDADDAPFSGQLRQLSLRTLCTNRDLVLQMPVSGAGGLTLDMAAPVSSVAVVGGPSRPAAPLADGAVAWRAISHLALNYVSLVNSSPREGAAALRDILGLYAPGADSGVRRQVEGVRGVSAAPVVRRLPPEPSAPGRPNRQAPALAFGRGLEVTIDVDELAFEGGSAYMFGAVLDRYLARYVSMNSFTETVLRSQTRGEISRWMPQWGARPTL
jgi:type VI secretion system protein ImpG